MPQKKATPEKTCTGSSLPCSIRTDNSGGEGSTLEHTKSETQSSKHSKSAWRTQRRKTRGEGLPKRESNSSDLAVLANYRWQVVQHESQIP